jgi:hypothetical protein
MTIRFALPRLVASKFRFSITDRETEILSANPTGHSFIRPVFDLRSFCIMDRNGFRVFDSQKLFRTQFVSSMSDTTVRGIVHVVEETKTYGQKGFRKRLVVLEQDTGRFTNYIPVEFLRDNCEAADDMNVGDEVEVSYQLSGRKWQRDPQSEVKYFLTAEALSFKKLAGGAEAPAAGSESANDAFAESNYDENDIPF